MENVNYFSRMIIVMCISYFLVSCMKKNTEKDIYRDELIENYYNVESDYPYVFIEIENKDLYPYGAICYYYWLETYTKDYLISHDYNEKLHKDFLKSTSYFC